MANRLYEEENVKAIADAIRTKNGTEETYTVAQMADAILALSAEGSGESTGITPTGSIEITSNGTHDVTNYASVIVNVPTQTQTYENLPSNIHVGTFTVDEAKNSENPIVVNHNIGIAPLVVYIMVDEISSVSTNALVGSSWVNGVGQSYIYKASSSNLTYSSNTLISDVNESSFTFVAPNKSNIISSKFTYRWFAWT